jgi:Tfp pilus assembly protein PilN
LDHLDVIVLADRLPQVIRRLALPGEAESLEERLPVITEEFNRTVSFYNSSHMECPLDAKVPVFVSGDLAEAPDMWPSVVGGAAYTVSALASSVPVPEGFSTNQFMVNIGLALKELLPEKEGANFSVVNFNALPEAYVPPRFSVVRVLIPVVTVIGVGLIVFVLILVLNSRANIATLGPQVTALESTVTQLQRDIVTLNGQIASAKGAADALTSTLVGIERGRAVILDDLREVTRLAGESVSLGSVSHVGSSVTISGTTTNVDYIFRYARALRESKEAANDPRFSSVWISSITGGGTAFSISLTK